jgi:hypothetical protein
MSSTDIMQEGERWAGSERLSSPWKAVRVPAVGISLCELDMLAHFREAATQAIKT